MNASFQFHCFSLHLLLRINLTQVKIQLKMQVSMKKISYFIFKGLQLGHTKISIERENTYASNVTIIASIY